MAMRRDVAGTSGVNASFRVSCQSGHSSVQEGQAASPVTSVLYLRVSTIDQTTANQERELREVATRMGCDIVKVYKDHGISGAKGREKRPAFDALCRDAAQRECLHPEGRSSSVERFQVIPTCVSDESGQRVEDSIDMGIRERCIELIPSKLSTDVGVERRPSLQYLKQRLEKQMTIEQLA
jgi:Resolvase, N terminal domain